MGSFPWLYPGNPLATMWSLLERCLPWRSAGFGFPLDGTVGEKSSLSLLNHPPDFPEPLPEPMVSA